jgi:leucyl/phenylalanyl-tRNA--protein transferase
MGHAHSIEVREDGELVGGLYGVSIGRMFFGESMFARRPDASKCALSTLVALLLDHGFTVIDCQQATSHLASLGGREIPRDAFLDRVATLAAQPGLFLCSTNAEAARLSRRFRDHRWTSRR